MGHCRNYNVKTETVRFFNQLQKHGGRLTEQRKAIVDTIMKFKTPFSAEEVLHNTDTLDLATIYRSLARFHELNLLCMINLGDGVTRYEYMPEENFHHHHHIVCTECKSIEAVNICDLNPQEESIEKMGYRNISHKLEFFGVCKKCFSHQHQGEVLLQSRH